MKNYRVTMVSAGNAELQESDVTEPTSHQVLIRNSYTAISAGTERAWSLDMNNAHPVFPYTPGYSGVGEVVRIGNQVTKLHLGDTVIVPWAGHQLYSLKEENLVKVPPQVDRLEAAFTHIASFPINGIRKLHLEFGESVMIAGQGILGIIALQVARLCGATPVMVADLSPERRKLARQLGADAALNPQDEDYVNQVKELTDGRGVNAVVEVTGHALALQQALEYIDFEGRIALLGCTRIPDVPIDFYKDVHCRGIQLLGAHTNSRAKLESHPYHWTENDDYTAFLKHLAKHTITLKPVISNVYSPRQAHEVYRMLATDRNPPLGLVFDWQNL